MAYDKRRIEKSQYVLGVKPSTLDAPIAAQAGDEPLTERDIADLRNVIAVAERGRMPDLAAQAQAMLDSGVLPARAAGKTVQAGEETMRQALQVCVKALEFRKERSANDEFALNLARIALAGSPRATADVERDAARWRALLDSARIRMIGSAGLMRAMPNNYAHFGMEIWTKYGTSLNAEQAQQMADGNVRGREWITKYADIAIEAQRATTKPGA